MKPVLVYGYTWRSNYGDELMTLLVALFLKHLHIPHVVYNLREDLAHKYDLVSSRDLESTIRSSSVCVISGGATFSHTRHHQVINNSAALYRALAPTSVPVLALSTGGDNFQDGPVMPLAGTGIIWRRGLFKAIVRSQNDCTALKALGIDAEHVPDILWTMYYLRPFLDVVPVQSMKERRYAALGWSGQSHSDRFSLRLFSPLLGVQPIRFSTTLAGNPDVSSVSHWKFSCGDPFVLARFLRGAEVVLDSQLHPGLSALALGTPNLCLAPNDKSRGFYTEMKWRNRMVTRAPYLLRGLIKARYRNDLCLNDAIVADLAQRALANFGALITAVRSVGFHVEAGDLRQALTDSIKSALVLDVTGERRTN
jgi:hypothetical protein